jgi:hypothetical protein
VRKSDQEQEICNGQMIALWLSLHFCRIVEEEEEEEEEEDFHDLIITTDGSSDEKGGGDAVFPKGRPLERS